MPDSKPTKVDIPDINFEPSTSNEHDYVPGEVHKLKQEIAFYQRLYLNARKSVIHYKVRLAKKDKGIMPQKTEETNCKGSLESHWKVV